MPNGIQWALTNLQDVQQYHSARRTILANGVEYIVCSRPEHLIGIEISDYKNIGGHRKPASFFINMIRLAQTRMRK